MATVSSKVLIEDADTFLKNCNPADYLVGCFLSTETHKCRDVFVIIKPVEPLAGG